jgi:predicted nucleotidyltransferase
MSNLPVHLGPREQAAVQECVARLRQTSDARLMSIWLFGSKARGDFGPDSDIDLLIVIPELDWSWWDQIRLISARVSLEYDVLLNTHILDQSRWNAQVCHKDTLWREMQRGSALLWQRDTVPATE